MLQISRSSIQLKKKLLYSHTLKCPYLYTQKNKSVRYPSFFSHIKTHWLQNRTSDLRNKQPRFPCEFKSMHINLCHLKWSHDLIVTTVACPFPSARQGKARQILAGLLSLLCGHWPFTARFSAHYWGTGQSFDLTTFWFRKPTEFLWILCSVSAYIYYVFSWKHRSSTQKC